MEGAFPGQILSFDSCVKESIADYKAIDMLPISNAKIKRAREIFKKRLSNSAAVQIASGPIDEIFLQGIAALDEEPLPTGLAGTVKIGSPD